MNLQFLSSIGVAGLICVGCFVFFLGMVWLLTRR